MKRLTMTLDNWLGFLSASELHSQLQDLPARKLHLLTAAFLRRVWCDLPSEHTRIAVEATEAFADGRVTAKELARLRSTDLLESCEGLWLAAYAEGHEEQLIGMGCWDCSYCDRAADEYVCRMTREGKPLDGVLATVEDPTWMAARAALHARETVAWKARPDDRAAVEAEEVRAQFDLFREIAGPRWTDPKWPRWRTTDVGALARGIHRDRAFDRLPILADALQDAGCDDPDVLQHCRGPLEGHVRGCWVVDLAMGYG